MNPRISRIIVIIVWILVPLALSILVYSNNPQLQNGNYNSLVILNFLQRLVGLWIFVMLTDQIIVGSFMSKITDKLGGWFYKFHITQGAIIYTLIVTHPLLYLLFLSIARNTFDPFYIFTDFCILCEAKSELWLTLGRISFWGFTATALAAKFRTLPFLRRNWKIVHFLNYGLFYLISLHAFYTGSDVYKGIFRPIFFACVLIVTATLFYRLIQIQKKLIRTK